MRCLSIPLARTQVTMHHWRKSASFSNVMLTFEWSIAWSRAWNHIVISHIWHHIGDKMESHRVSKEILHLAFSAILLASVFGAFRLENPYFTGNPSLILLIRLDENWSPAHSMINICGALVKVCLIVLIIPGSSALQPHHNNKFLLFLKLSKIR